MGMGCTQEVQCLLHNIKGYEYLYSRIHTNALKFYENLYSTETIVSFLIRFFHNFKTWNLYNYKNIESKSTKQVHHE